MNRSGKILSVLFFFGLPFIGFTQSDPGNEIDTCSIVNVPESFSGNGDQINDFFQVETKCELTDFKITIFNRWGEIIYEAKGQDFKWNGKDKKGMALGMGTFMYVITFNVNGQEYTKNGNFVLMR